MEWKIGEIKQVNGEWYQCIRSSDCPKCDLKSIQDCRLKFPCEPLQRNDCEEVIFKKLEKVGEPYEHCGKLYQCYKLPMEIEIRLLPNNCNPIGKDNLVEIEIKQNKEDMEEKKQKLDKLVDDYMACRIQYAEFDKELKALYDKEESKPTLKEFSLEAAKAGKPVCTRDGRKARILCYDLKGAEYPIVAAVETRDCFAESIFGYDKNGRFDHDTENNNDLMMLPEKKEGWIVISKEAVYDKETAEKIARETTFDVIKIQKIEWEE